jgi:putative spermidine/putrescine transport system ATP-binding protein
MAAIQTPDFSASSPQSDRRPATADVKLLRLRVLSASAGRATLHGVSLDMERGETVALLGPEDGGRSLLLQVIAGFVAGGSGDILLDGRPIGRTPTYRRGIGVVERAPGLLPHLSVAENVALPLRLRGVAKAQRTERVARMLELLAIGEAAARRPAALNAATQVRTALARALVFEPRLVLLDDPFAGLAAEAREALQLDLRRLRVQTGAAMLLATGDAAEALLLGDRVGVLAGGMLRQIGTPQALYDAPGSAMVAASVGAANLLGGTYVRPDEDMAEIHLDCGIAVQARPMDVAPGQRCVVMIRPERVALAAVNAEEMGDGALPAVVEEVLYQGEHVRLRLRVGAPGARPAMLVVRRPAGAPMLGLTPGRPAAVAWQAHHACAFRPEPGAGRNTVS